ncbi:phospholipid carrier-dependent glycosyltransferase [soil metagenome]
MRERIGRIPSWAITFRRMGDGTAWDRRDAAIAALLALVAGALRAWRFTSPHRLYFDETFYIPDARLYLHGPGPGAGSEVTALHPPLGKWLLAAGIQIFGDRPGGWRITALVVGTLAVPLLYLLARRLLGSRFYAAVAAGFLAFDFLAFVQSRIAMLDVFAFTLGLASVTCAVSELQGAGGHEKRTAWRLGAGILGGAAVAAKWSGLYMLVLAVGLIVLGSLRRRRGEVGDRGGRLRSEIGSLLLFLVLIPIVVYCLTFAGRVDGSLLAVPWQQGSWVRSFLHLQLKDMLLPSLHLRGIHPSMSPAWSWPLDKRPVEFSTGPHEGRILAFGDPFLWWPALAALAYLAVRVARGRGKRGCDGVVLAGFVAAWAPWLLLGQERSFTFLYYFLPAVPFLYLALARFCQTVPRGAGRAVAAGLLVVSAVAFSLYFPLLTGRGISPAYESRLLLFEDCKQRVALPSYVIPTKNSTVVRRGGEERTVRLEPPTPPPVGWCWR